MVRSFRLHVGGIVATLGVVAIAGCGARSAVEQRAYLDSGVSPPDGGTPAEAGVDSSVEAGVCNATNCGGCCDKQGHCSPGLFADACGIGGEPCVDCTLTNASCNAGTHECGPAQPCNPSTCPGGCCTHGGLCVSGTDSHACGTGGETCSDCTANGQTCDPGGHFCTTEVSCGPGNCGGCCAGPYLCVWGGDLYQCGSNGEPCQDCSSWLGYKCDPDIHQCTSTTTACGPWTCPNGCCDASTGQCLEGVDSWACGSGGQVCQSCAEGTHHCVPLSAGGGFCDPGTPTCGPSSCQGCCECPDPQDSCKCVDGVYPKLCGHGGQVCQACVGDGMTCEPTSIGGGQCVYEPQVCGPDNCSGCCDDTTWPAQCVGGTDNWACGGGGMTCQACGPASVCVASPNGGGSCVSMQDSGTDCGPWNCVGCCNHATYPPYCDVGTQPWSCGTAGDPCAPCPPGAQCVAIPPGGGVCAIPPDASADAPPPGCGPWNCQGCCTANGNCVPGQGNKRCGVGGVQCVDCTIQNGTCQGGQCLYPGTCPAAYGGCPSYQSVVIPYTKPNACSPATLDNVANTCAGSTTPPACGQLLLDLQQTDPACGQCLWQFTGPDAGATCVAPYLSDTCNHATACTFDCLNVACNQCPDTIEQQCRADALTGSGACTGYTQGFWCYLSATQGQASFCAWHGDYGKWIYVVGNHYCGTGSP